MEDSIVVCQPCRPPRPCHTAYVKQQRSVIFEAKHPQFSFCVTKKWTNTLFSTSKVTPHGVVW